MRPSFIFGTQIKIFLLKSESLQSNATTTFKAQKGSKDIIKIVHVTSVVQPYSYEAMWIFLHAKNTKITTLFNISSLPSLLEFTTVPRQMCVMLLVQEPFWCRTHMHCALFAKRNEHLCVMVLSRMPVKTDMEENTFLNKVIIFVFFAHKTYSRSYVKLRLNHWCHMDYLNNGLTTFLGLECCTCVAVYGGSESSRISSKIS